MKTHPTLRCGLLVMGLLLISAQIAASQPRLEIAGESRIWIEGSSSVNSFTCETGTVHGFGYLKAGSAEREPVVVEVQVSVWSFECGKSRMNADLYEALKAEQHPQILFNLEAAVLTSPSTDPGVFPLRITGRLLIAGTERTVSLEVVGQQHADGTYRAIGSLPLLMSDFGIEPPTALLGLIKAHNEITVRFDLVAARKDGYYTN